MKAIDSRVVGRCEGYRPGAVFDLEDGSYWVQVSDRAEFVLRDRPKARIWRDSTGYLDLDLEGTSVVVRVERYSGRRCAGPGAF